jgi:hypothetical protein
MELLAPFAQGFAVVRYRTYAVGNDGHFQGPPEEVQCSVDQAVIATARQMQNGLDPEIWDHKRFVIRLTGKAPK